MNSQLFKKTLPISTLIKFIDDNCVREGKFHVFSKTCFRRAVYHDRIQPFCNILTDCYHNSKKYYIEREMDYTKFTTVLRQVCKLHNLPYASRIVYDKSTYDIHYYIQLGDEFTDLDNDI